MTDSFQPTAECSETERSAPMHRNRVHPMKAVAALVINRHHQHMRCAGVQAPFVVPLSPTRYVSQT